MSRTCIYETIQQSPRRVKVYRDSLEGYVVRLYLSAWPVPYAPADYFTEDREDAINSAHAMM